MEFCKAGRTGNEGLRQNLRHAERTPGQQPLTTWVHLRIRDDSRSTVFKCLDGHDGLPVELVEVDQVLDNFRAVDLGKGGTAAG